MKWELYLGRREYHLAPSLAFLIHIFYMCHPIIATICAFINRVRILYYHSKYNYEESSCLN